MQLEGKGFTTKLNTCTVAANTRMQREARGIADTLLTVNFDEDFINKEGVAVATVLSLQSAALVSIHLPIPSILQSLPGNT